MPVMEIRGDQAIVSLEPVTLLRNQLEPAGLLDAFCTEPPENFLSQDLGTENDFVPGFIAPFNLLTTMDESLKTQWQKISRYVPGFLQKLLTPQVLFVGTVVSEYAIFSGSVNFESLTTNWLQALRRAKAPCLIVKDLPIRSPLLSAEENQWGEALITHLKEQNFLIVSGQALGYVPIDCTSREDYLKRFTSNRRNNIKRKLKAFQQVSVREVELGDPFFTEEVLDALYNLYLNVYENSYIHFDKLTPAFFKKVLTDATADGVVFLFYKEEKLVGFSLCFRYQQILSEKYLGFLYPDSREVNLYYLSWFYKLEYAMRHGFETLVVGWTSPEIKAYLGAEFTETLHAVYIKNPVLRWLMARFQFLFESDKRTMERLLQKVP